MQTIQLKLFNEILKREKIAGRTKFFCGPHVRHLWSRRMSNKN